MARLWIRLYVGPMVVRNYPLTGGVDDIERMLEFRSISQEAAAHGTESRVVIHNENSGQTRELVWPMGNAEGSSDAE